MRYGDISKLSIIIITIILWVLVPAIVLTIVGLQNSTHDFEVIVYVSYIVLKELYFFVAIWLLAIIAYGIICLKSGRESKSE